MKPKPSRTPATHTPGPWNAESFTESLVNEIESIRSGLSLELGVPENDKAVQAGVEMYAKGRAEDLTSEADLLARNMTAYSMQDSLRAAASQIRKTYLIR